MPALIPVGPGGLPVFAGEFALAGGEEVAVGPGLLGEEAAIVPIDEGFEEAEAIFGVIGAEFASAGEVLAGARAAADAGGPAWGLVVELAEVAVGGGVFEGGLEFDGALEFLFHFTDEAEGAEGFGAGELAKVEREEEMGCRMVWGAFEELAAGVDAFDREGGALGVGDGKLGAVEAGFCELDGELGGGGGFGVIVSGLEVEALGAFDEAGVGGGGIGGGEGCGEQGGKQGAKGGEPQAEGARVGLHDGLLAAGWLN